MRKILLILCLFFFAIVEIQAKKTIYRFNIVFIGNSITMGSYFKNPSEQAPPAITVKYLNKHNCCVQFANCGVSGSTTVDFLPLSHRLFPKVVASADTFYLKNVPLVFSIKLGTNDSAVKGPNGSPVSPDDYKRNMLTIIDTLLQRYPKCHIILHCPIWYSPNTHNSSLYMSEGLKRLQTYRCQIISICKLRPTKVFIGDKMGFSLFKSDFKKYLRPENGESGVFFLHPNELGAEKLGKLWGTAIQQYCTKF